VLDDLVPPSRLTAGFAALGAAVQAELGRSTRRHARAACERSWLPMQQAAVNRAHHAHHGARCADHQTVI
jgi:hypothetical protein